MSGHSKHYLLLTARTNLGLLSNLREIWEYRELVFFLAWREVTSRYRQAALGAAWAMIQPLTTMLLFNIIFGKLVKVPSDGIPYPLFSYAALLPWQYFQTATQTASNSLVTNTNLITKVYFPRLVIPLAAVLPALLDFAIALCFFVCLMIYFGFVPNSRLAWLPVFLSLAICFALGVGLWCSALCVQYRDIRHVIPFLMQLLMFASPVAYSGNLIPDKWRFLYALNPMVAVIDGFRWSCLGAGEPPLSELFCSTSVIVVLLLSGTLFFRKMERKFADVI